MKLVKRLGFLAIIILLMLILGACGPEEDKTDPLSGYNVDVNLPFATSDAHVITTPRTSRLSGWLGESVELTEGDYTALQLGDIGTKVRNLQKRLIELGYMSGTASGTYNQATAQAVRQFEESYGQAPTGTASELMQYYLFSDAVKKYTAAATARVTATPLSYRTLQRGDSGDDVARLQQRLYELGYLSQVSGSYFDVYTETAVKDFESAYNRSRTGIATIELQTYLYSTNARYASQVIRTTPTPTPRPTPTPAPYADYATLEYGDKGSDVTALQNRLRQLGYLRSKADGIYGEKTVEAIRAFEAAYGQRETGIATPALQYYLFSSDARRYGTVTPTPTFTPTPTGFNALSYGSSGDEVLRLQLRLIELGYLSGSADGVYGRATQTAVSLFETQHGRTATGVATSALQSFLYSQQAQPMPTQQAVPGYSDLSVGSFGTDVLALQQRLRQLGYFSGAEDGYYGQDTAQAIMAFEEAYGRSLSGVATAALQSVLFSDSAKAAPRETALVYTALQKGDKGDAVKLMQERLMELGYLAGSADGYYGDGTQDAVRAFEAANGRAQTGVASSELQALLYSSSARRNNTGDVAVSYSSLKSGDTGAAVSALQARLISLGYMPGTATGTYDARTVNGVKSFQKAMGLSQTGAASSAMQKTLYSSSAKDASASKATTVNRPAYVSATSADVYAYFSDNAPSATLRMGQEVTVLRTRGLWAEVQSSGGATGYMLLESLTYITQDVNEDSLVTINAGAVITQNDVAVYKSWSTSSGKMATLSKGTYVLWLRSRGEWAEIKNTANGVVGYIRTSQLMISDDVPQQQAQSSYTTLQNGSKGEEVKALQRRLTELNYFYGDIGGNYLSKTTDAVKRFQYQIGLETDGVATPGLQEILYSVYAPSYKSYTQSSQLYYTDMYQGRSDNAVKALQQRLSEYGYLSSGSVSGKYDSKTISAVQQIQQRLGFSRTDGIATRELQAFLMSKGSAALKK